MQLLTPYRMNDLTLPNRTVMAPITRNRASLDGVPDELAALYYAQRASAGLIISESIYVSPLGKGYVATAGMHTDEQEAGWHEVTDTVHAAGGRIFAQLVHVGRITHESLLPEGGTAVAPSAIKADAEVFTVNGLAATVQPRALDTDELPGIVAEFTAAARRAIAAGFDGVEVHAANGYLLHQFLSTGSNLRTDGNGGSAANQVRLVVEVAASVADAIGADKVGVRVSPANPYNDMRETDVTDVYSWLATALDQLGVTYLHVVDGGGEPVKAIRAHLRGTIIANGVPGGAATGREEAATALANGADLVAFGRAFLANPDLPLRLALGADLNAVDFSTLYGGDGRGYTDYPTLAAVAA